jgi:hypothetical protein
VAGEGLEAGAEHAHPRDLAVGDLGIGSLLDDEPAIAVRPPEPVAEAEAVPDRAGAGRLGPSGGTNPAEFEAMTTALGRAPTARAGSIASSSSTAPK